MSLCSMSYEFIKDFSNSLRSLERLLLLEETPMASASTPVLEGGKETGVHALYVATAVCRFTPALM